MNIAVQLTILAILSLFSGFFSASETALFSLSKIDKKKVKEQYPSLSAWIFDHLAAPRKTLGTILIGNMIVNTLATAILTFLVVELWGDQRLGLVMAAFTVFLIIFCEIIPKTLAVHSKIKMALFTAIPLRFFAYVLSPFRFLMRFVAEKVISVLIHEKVDHSDMISENELKVLVKIGEEEGVLDSQERHMIQKLLDLGERPVKDIMTPRTDLIGLDVEDGTEKHVELIKKNFFKYIPVFQESLDNILGVIDSQDYLLRDPVPPVQKVQKPALFIPESKRIGDLLEDFRLRRDHFAVCVDEYGGTAGVVTQEDILEEIFGEFYDEYAKVENPIRRLNVDSYIVEGKLPLQDFNEYFLVKLEVEEASTLGGYLLEKLGVVPVRGTKYETEEFEFVIQSMIRQRIQHVLVRKKT